MCPFKLNEDLIYVGELSLLYYNGLTPGKTYKVTECICFHPLLGVTNDTGCKLIPNWNNFIYLKEQRRRKLNKILIF